MIGSGESRVMHEHFSTTFSEARQRFRDAATGVGAEQISYPLAISSEQPLSIDVAVFGDRTSDSAVVVSSACHGVEGFFGSAVQLAWLKAAATHQKNLNKRCVLIHGINPYGFAELRRFNEDNIDINRNFLRQPVPYEGSPEGYASLNGFLNPQSPPSTFEFFRLKALWNILRMGLNAVKTAVAGGQYEFPKGLFFGGKAPCVSTQIIQKYFESWIQPSNKIVHIDLHSGLGEFGKYKLLLTDSEQSMTDRWFSKIFEKSQVEPLAKSDGVAYAASGTLGEWIQFHLGSRAYRYAAAEFGTHDIIRVLGSLRAENRAHFYGSAGSDSFTKAKAELLECFCPADPQWRNAVVAQGLEIIEGCLQSEIV